MTRLKIDHGICGFETTISMTSNPDGTVIASLDSTCPSIMSLPEDVLTFDPVMEMTPSATLHEVLIKHLPHRSCLLIPALIKAAEVEAGLALKKDAHISYIN